MNKSELLAKIDLLRVQGNQTDIAGVLADVLQEIVESIGGKTLEIKTMKNFGGVPSSEFIEELGITASQFQNLFNGEYNEIKSANATLSLVGKDIYQTEGSLKYGCTGTEIFGSSYELSYNENSDEVSASIVEV